MDLVRVDLELFTGEAFDVRQVDEHEVVVRAAGDELEALLHHGVGQSRGVLDDLFLVRLELGFQSFAEADCFGSDDMLQRTALAAREDGLVEVVLLVGFLVAEDHTAAGTAKGLVRGGRDDVRVRNGARMEACGNETGDVRHVDPEDGAALVGDLTEALEVDDARVRGGTGDDHLRLLFDSELFERVVVDVAFVVNTVRNDVVEESGEVDGRTVGQVTAGVEGHAEDLVAGLTDGHGDSHVSLCAGMGLDVGIVAAEKLLGSLDGEGLELVDDFAAAVVTLARITFGIFIGEDRAHGQDDGLGNDVFRGDQFDVATLSLILLEDAGPYFRVSGGDGFHDVCDHVAVLLTSACNMVMYTEFRNII